jgi:predicted nucleic acid-binding Zn ribbon protein
MKRSDQTKKEFVHIGSIIGSLLSTYQPTPTSTVGRLAQILNMWDAVAGSTIAQNTKPKVLKGKLLTVNVTSSVWLQQLQFTKNELIIRLNAALGAEEIENIKFKIGRIC